MTLERKVSISASIRWRRLTCSAWVWSLEDFSISSSSARAFRLACITASDFRRRPSSSRRRVSIWSVKFPAATRSAIRIDAEIGLLMEYAKAIASSNPISAVPTAIPSMVVRAAATVASASVR